MKRMILALTIVAATSLSGGALAQEAAGQTPPTPRPPQDQRLGVVDLAGVFKGYKKSKDLEEKINAERDRLKKDLDDVRQQIAQITKEMELLDPKQEAYKEKEMERALLSKKFEILKDRLETQIRARWEQFSLEIIDDIEAAVREFGEAQKFTLILRVDGKTNEDTRLLQSSLKAVLYYSPNIDITQAIIEKLNRTYDLAAPAAPPGTPKPPAPPVTVPGPAPKTQTPPVPPTGK